MTRGFHDHDIILVFEESYENPEMSCQNKSKLKGRQLQAIKDFNAADVCFSDGANPLSFQIGDHFTFLSYRDKHWANVERTILNNNSILLIETYPPTEQGIIPTDYVIEMDTAITEDESVKTEQNGSDQESLSESQDNEALKVKKVCLHVKTLLRLQNFTILRQEINWVIVHQEKCHLCVKKSNGICYKL